MTTVSVALLPLFFIPRRGWWSLLLVVGKTPGLDPSRLCPPSVLVFVVLDSQQSCSESMLSGHNILLLVASVMLGQWLRSNPLWFGMTVGDEKLPSNATFPVYTSHFVLDAVLEHHRTAIGEADYDKYRNHCLRVLSLAGYYLHKYDGYPKKDGMPPHVLDVMALALAYHDIGLWTKGAMNYLEPSVATLDQDLANDNPTISLPAHFSDADLATARMIIRQHHKYAEWEPADNDVTEKRMNAAAVNAVRRADWADATVGLIKTGLPPAYLEQVYKVLPELGFHAMLLGMGQRLSPHSIVGQLQVFKIFKW